ncbi:hypothetical protein F5Y08DRAFT_342270 [Xylaria arbuscula]|nr:hypothetical protein F5Y08DRAFT_342270 [Xylaria arbuscula]
MSIIYRQHLIAPIVISIFNVAVAVTTTWIAVKRPPAARDLRTDLRLVTVIWTSRAIQFWVALAAILLYAAPAPIERSFVVVAAGIIGNLYNDWIRQLEIFRYVLGAPSKNMLLAFRTFFGISVVCVVLFVPDLILTPSKWPRIAPILVCVFHRVSIAVPILLYRGHPIKRTENLLWAGGNALGAITQFFGLLLAPFECRLFLYVISSVFTILSHIPAITKIDKGDDGALLQLEENKSTVSIGGSTFQVQSRWSLDSEIPRRQVPHWVTDKISSSYFSRTANTET